jgi:myosin heavy subunit
MALNKLIKSSKNQAIIISGGKFNFIILKESGAGKTENTKYCMNLLAYYSSKN